MQEMRILLNVMLLRLTDTVESSHIRIVFPLSFLR
jgi:hypothetical protein